MAKTSLKNKKVILGLTAVSALTAGILVGSIQSIAGIQYKNPETTTKLNDKVVTPNASERVPELSASDYTPVLANQNVLPTITNDGYIGIGSSKKIVSNDGTIVQDTTTKRPLIDGARTITFTTFDGVLRWVFDLNQLNDYPSIVDTPEAPDSSMLRIVDVKPLMENQGFIVLATACGNTKTAASYTDNVLFQITTDGKILPETYSSFSLPTIGSGTVKELLNNSPISGNKILSPYNLKISRSKNTALVQISANPTLLKPVAGKRITVQDYFSNEVVGGDYFFPDGSDATCPIVLLQYSYIKKSFDYQKSTADEKVKRLVNYLPKSAFINYSTSSSVFEDDAEMASEWIFYKTYDTFGFYSTYFSNDLATHEKTLKIYSNSMVQKVFTPSNEIHSELVDTSSELYRPAVTGYNGYAYSFVPYRYMDTSASPCAEIIIPGENSFKLLSILAEGERGSHIFKDWIKEEEDTTKSNFTPKCSYIDPMYGNVVFSSKQDNDDGSVSFYLDYLDIAQINYSDNTALPVNFNLHRFNISDSTVFKSAVENVHGPMYPISSSNSIYNPTSEFYTDFRMIGFDGEGNYNVLSLADDDANVNSLVPTFKGSSSYKIQTFLNVQNQAKDIGWVPSKVMLSEIKDSRFQTIGNLSTVTDPDDTANLPLFFSKIRNEQSFFPLDGLKVDHIEKDFENSLVTFDAHFSYDVYGTNKKSIYSQSYRIYGFKKDPTLIKANVFEMPRFEKDSNAPLVVNSPISYQGYYSSLVDYKKGQQIAFKDNSLGAEALVYEVIEDKKASINLYDPTTNVLQNSLFHKYFRVVKDLEGKKQKPYDFSPVANFKGEYNPATKYRVGDVVRDSTNNFLYIIDDPDTQPTTKYPGTDLSVLLPSSLTPNHVAMIIKEKLVTGTLPEGFNNSNIIIEDFNFSNLANDEGKAWITARFRLNKYIDKDGNLVNNSNGWKNQPITINFSNPSTETRIKTEYNVSEFGDLLKDKYAYELTSEALNNDANLKQKLIEINRDLGNLSDDITINNVFLSQPDADDGSGILRLTMGLNRWYNEQGVLTSSSMKIETITIEGFKHATVTQFTTGKINLRADQLGVPGLNDMTPSEVTAAQFGENELNIKDFILNYIIADGSGRKLIIDSARPANFGREDIVISSKDIDSATGVIKLSIKFKSYFDTSSLGIITHTTSNGINTKSHQLIITGFKKFIDNSVDNFEYDAVINIRSDIKESGNFPPELNFGSTNLPPIPGMFYDENTDRMTNILKNVLVSYFTTPEINGEENKQRISGFGLLEIGEISDVFYNNFTGKIIFKANLKRFVKIEHGEKKEITNNDPDWETNPNARYNFSLNGFSLVKASTFNQQQIPYNLNQEQSAAPANAREIGPTTIRFNLDVKNIGNKNINDISYNDIKNQVQWGGSWGILQAPRPGLSETLTLTSMDSLIANNGVLKSEPYITRDLVNNTAELNFVFEKDIYYFAQKDLTNDNSVDEKDPYTLGNLGQPQLLKAGSKIVVSLNNVNKFNLWEIVFWVGVGVVGFILLSLICFSISRASHKRDIY